jgi:DNA polymerase IV
VETEVVPAILHVDMDAFFAAVEVLDNPELAGHPVIVGGSGARGVVASCNYEARRFGIRSAMPSVRAQQLCPEAIFVDGRHGRYGEVSQQLHEILLSATPLVEPIGLDEAFLDVSGSRRLLGSPEQIAHAIRHKVREQLSLDCSIGIGRTKMVAKLASRGAKPTVDRLTITPGVGVMVVLPSEETAFLHPMPVEALWGVGPATARRLHHLGVRTVGDLAQMPRATMVRRLGQAQGAHLLGLAQGEDPSPVVPNRAAKSIGHEETFSRDITDPALLQRHVLRMAESVATMLRGSDVAGRTITVKVKFADFTSVTRSHTLPLALDTGHALGAVAAALLGGIDPDPGVRLLGVSASGLQASTRSEQLAFDLVSEAEVSLDGDEDLAQSQLAGRRGTEAQRSWQEVTAAIDAIRHKFGKSSVGTAAMVSDDGIAVPSRRDAPWGPSAKDDSPPD